MRHFNLAVVAVGALYVSMGCGSSGAHLDGGGGDMSGGNQDFSTNPPDMAKAPPGCFAVLGNQMLASKATAATKAKVNAFINCALTTCGSTQIVDGGNAAKPCAMTVDGGASAACDQCFSNIQVNDQKIGRAHV